MFISLNELRENAYKILSSGKWLAAVQADEREVYILHDGVYYCHEFCCCNDFKTDDIDEAVNYLYPEY